MHFIVTKEVEVLHKEGLLDEGKICSLVTAFIKSRMDDFIAEERGKGFEPVVVVAGRTANAAFETFQLAPESEEDLCGMKIVRYKTFTCIRDAPHP